MRLIAILLVLCVAEPSVLDARVTPTHGFDLFSAQEEIQAGRQAAAEIPRQLPLLPDSNPVTQYIQHLGRDLAAHAPGEKWPYSFHVVNKKEINAFALPGGPVYVNMGTIRAADSEAQLAGVIAHEISHVVQRHGTRAASKQMAAQLPLAILGGVLGRGALSQMAQLGLSFGVGSYFLKNSRQSEKEADLLGADIMYDSGFDPRAMAQFFEKIQAQGGARAPEFFSDHPDPGNRSEYVMAEVDTLPRKSQYRGDSAEFRQIKQEISGGNATDERPPRLTRAQKPAEPPVQAAPPSTGMRNFEHDDFQISYPDDWQVFGDRTSAVTIAPRNGVTENAVAYGVMVSTYQPEDARATLDQATHSLLNSLRQSNPDLRQIGNDETIRVNSLAGRSVDLIGSSPLPNQSGGFAQERDWLVTTQRRDGSLLYLVFIAPDKDFSSYRPTFEQMLRTLKLR